MRFSPLFFRGDGRPRSLVRIVLFHPNRVPRKAFRRIAFKKNGSVRPAFHQWIARLSVSELTSAFDMAYSKLAVLEKLVPLEEQVKNRLHAKVPNQVLSPQELKDALNQVPGNWLILSIGHDDYTSIPGGVQVCIQREESLTKDRGGRYLNIYPWQPLPRLAHLQKDSDPYVVLVLDGAHIGVCRMSDLIETTRRSADLNTQVFVAIHHLLGHNPEQIAELAQTAEASEVVLWLHDYFSLCPGVRLQRNDLDFCGAPEVDSNACGLCVYGTERRSHLERMKHLFDVLMPTVLAPSQVTQDLWLKRATFRVSRTEVVPHVILDWTPRSVPEVRNDNDRIRVGFLGTATPHKGWPTFEKLTYSPALKDRFEFLALTTHKMNLCGRRVTVHVTPEQPNAMTDAVRAQEIDLVVHWPDWPETFALTAYEALEGGAFLVTNEGSGNVAATIQKLGRGKVLTDKDTLFDFFEGGGAETLAEQARADRASQTVFSQLSDMSLTVLKGKR